MSKQVNYNENLCAGAAIRDDKGRRISKLFEASHPKMTVGYAKNLIMPDDPTEQEFNFRQSGGGVIEDGVAVIDKVKGNSVVWNQRIKIQLAETRTINGITFTKNPYGSITASGTATANATYSIPCDSMVAGHRYLFCASDNGSASTYGFEVANKTGNDVFEFDSNLFNPTIITPSQNGIEGFFALRVWAGATVNVVFRPRFIDLTQMFGAGNEPSTYEEFIRRKPKVADEYAYNEGTIVNNKVEGVKTTGINLWDEQWEIGAYDVVSNGSKIEDAGCIRSKGFIEVCNAAAIYLYIGNNTKTRVIFYDANKRFLISPPSLANAILSIPEGSHYFTFYQRVSPTTYNHDICINLSDPSINGQYFPYEKHELDLSWAKDIKDAEGVKLFEDGIKSAGTAFDEVGKNKAVKRIEKVVFDGTESWNYNPKDDKIMPYINNFFPKRGEPSTIKHCKSNYYLEDYSGVAFSEQPIGTIQCRGDLKIVDLWESIGAWKQHLAELYAAGTPLVLYYELAEPIVVEYDEKNLTYPVVAGGTEEAIASEPSTAFRADIGYGIDAVKTILDLKARVEALEGK